MSHGGCRFFVCQEQPGEPLARNYNDPTSFSLRRKSGLAHDGHVEGLGMQIATDPTLNILLVWSPTIAS